MASMLGKWCWKTETATTASAMGGLLKIRTCGKMPSRPCCVGSSSMVVWGSRQRFPCMIRSTAAPLRLLCMIRLSVAPQHARKPIWTPAESILTERRDHAEAHLLLALAASVRARSRPKMGCAQYIGNQGTAISWPHLVQLFPLPSTNAGCISTDSDFDRISCLVGHASHSWLHCDCDCDAPSGHTLRPRQLSVDRKTDDSTGAAPLIGTMRSSPLRPAEQTQWLAWARPGGDRLKEIGRAVSVGAVENLDQDQKSESAGGHSGYRRHVLNLAPHSRRY
jgi:hypothetical protein